MEKKKFKFKIRVQAEHYETAKDLPEGIQVPANLQTFEQVVHEWYNNQGMANLLDYLNKKDENGLEIPVQYYSYLIKFESSRDGVDKEAYD